MSKYRHNQCPLEHYHENRDGSDSSREARGRFHRGGRPRRDRVRSGARSGRARRGQLRDSILRLLSETSLNGYQLMTSVADKTMDAWLPSPGAIYPCLARMEAEGLILAIQTDAQRVYSLTDAGRAAADQVAAEPWAEVAYRPTEHFAMMEQLRDLTMTVRYASQTATSAQLTAIATSLEDTRKHLLTILAAD